MKNPLFLIRLFSYLLFFIGLVPGRNVQISRHAYAATDEGFCCTISLNRCINRPNVHNTLANKKPETP